MGKIELQKLSPEELISLAETNVSDFRWDRADIYKIAFEKYKGSNEKEKLEDVRKEILIFDLFINKQAEKRFDSMMSGFTDKGKEWKYPDLEKDFPKETVEYYKKRTNITNNPILKARYSDVVWELDEDILFARLTVRAYLDCCPIYFANEWDYELSDSLDRAIAIASMINDPDLLHECSKKHYDFMKQMAEKRRFRYLFEIAKSILAQEKKFKGQIDYQYLISVVEAAIAHYIQNVPDSFHIQRNFMELLWKIGQIRKKSRECKKIKVRIAENFIEEAEWKKSNYPNGNMVAASFYQKALQVYVDIGGFPEKIKELKIKIQDANETASKTEYKTISTEVKIPKEEIETDLKKWSKMYEGKKTIEVFQIMSLDPTFIPSYEKAKDQAVEQAKKFVIQHMFPRAIMKGNICVKEISEEDEKLEYSTITNFKIGYRFCAQLLLVKIFDLLEKEHPRYVKTLTQYLSSTGIVDKGRIEIIEHGLRAFGNKEYVAAIHIFVFQIEGILRDLLGKLGLPTFSYRSNEMRERMLSDILVTLSRIKGMDKDFLKFMEVYLCDVRGDNYRNDVAHGLLPLQGFTKENAQLLLLILIKLASYSIVKENITEGT